MKDEGEEGRSKPWADSAGGSTFPGIPEIWNQRELAAAVGSGFFFDQKSNLALLRLRRRHELADRGK